MRPNLLTKPKQSHECRKQTYGIDMRQKESQSGKGMIGEAVTHNTNSKKYQLMTERIQKLKEKIKNGFLRMNE